MDIDVALKHFPPQDDTQLNCRIHPPPPPLNGRSADDGDFTQKKRFAFHRWRWQHSQSTSARERNAYYSQELTASQNPRPTQHVDGCVDAPSEPCERRKHKHSQVGRELPSGQQ
ncbi:hypothetical protein L227DRAFT_572042 [Lentinus tigrinus ALCF2SS1-6]|uniref:Uncharacterized protein n=1 Tax=Lentinus tigrinus ALCF2SS1-6 TaxID=1328759 RepID=A0A5C2SN31_9APHY|nr:hypothetical protein L227DRAFT_572042 [Lentinus tigrinus ALCF2SS1-6]